MDPGWIDDGSMMDRLLSNVKYDSWLHKLSHNCPDARRVLRQTKTPKAGAWTSCMRPVVGLPGMKFSKDLINGHAGQEPIDWRYLPYMFGLLF